MSKKKLNKFLMQAEIGILSKVNALEIGRNLKVGLWKEQSGDYINGENTFKNLNVSNVEIRFVEIDQELNIPYFIVAVECDFEAGLDLETARTEGCLFFGKDCASLKDETKPDTYVIETVDYVSFELSEFEE